MRLRSGSSRPPRRASKTLVAAVFATSLFALSPGLAQNAGAPYHGYANGTIIHVDALTTDGTRVADAELGIGSAQVDSEGLSKVHNVYQRVVVPGTTSAKHVGAHSSILEAGALLSPPDAENTVKPFIATTFDNDEPVDESVVREAVSPIAFVELLTNKAATVWNGDACVLGEPMADGQQRVSRLDVLETGDDPDTPELAGFDKPLFALEGFSAGPRRGVSDVISREWLYVGNGGNFGLYSVTTTTLMPVTLFGGTENELTVEIAGPAYLVARADGSPGGAVVAYSAPLVSLIQGGVATTLLPDKPYIIDEPDSNNPLIKIRVNAVEPLPGPNGIAGDTTLGNGTKAAAVANVLEVTLLDDVAGLKPGATFALGHMEAAATVPAGGITCELPVTKSASPSSVQVGNPFTTTIKITNPYACTISNLQLGDEISIENSARFTFLDTDPSTSMPGGSNLSSADASWSLGSLAPGASKEVDVVLGARNGVGRILDTATASGSLTNCPAAPAGAGADVTGLAKVSVPVTGANTLSVSTTQVLGSRIKAPLPRLGVGNGLIPPLAMLGLAAALAITLRRRKTV